ncbi:hypothetical protein E4T56_gene15661, partial [Termitomyces sp. T112]
PHSANLHVLQAHINNLYNTVFWALVQLGGETTTQAHATLRGTVSKEKHEILFTRFQINYNQIDERFRKGSVLVRKEVTEPAVTVNTQGSAPHGPSDASDDTLVVSAFSPFEQKRTKLNRELKRDTKPKTEVVRVISRNIVTPKQQMDAIRTAKEDVNRIRLSPIKHLQLLSSLPLPSPFRSLSPSLFPEGLLS